MVGMNDPIVPGGGSDKPRAFALDEQSTTFTIDAEDRSKVRVYSNDQVFIARLEKVGATPYRACDDGGMFYDIHIDQLLLRKGKRQMSPEARAAAGQRLAALREGSESPLPSGATPTNFNESDE